MQMVVHDREPAHGDRENLREFLDPIFNPRFAIERAFAFVFTEQERASDTTRL
jgi:hypothetical protein